MMTALFFSLSVGVFGVGAGPGKGVGPPGIIYLKNN
jgi:hypothetical protein